MACFESATFRLLVAIFFTFSIIIFQQSTDWLPRPTYKHPPTYREKFFGHKNETSSTKTTLATMETEEIAYTSNVYTSADIINAKTSYEVNDTISIRIIARDINNVPKTHGGDYFRVKLYTAKLQASLSIDVTNDLGNGTYIADVTLRWPGNVDVIVLLVHPSEAIRVLERIRDLQPGRTIYTGRYSRIPDSGVQVYEDVMCLPKVIKNDSLCNFTDEQTGYPWFCVAPSKTNLSCDDWQFYTSDYELMMKITLEAVSEEEKKIFQVHKLPIKKPPSPLNVNGNYLGWSKTLFAYQDSLPHCKAGQHLHNPTPSGFYMKNTWWSDQCKLRRFSKPDVLQCLTNRSIHIRGDSTARQFYMEFAGKYKPEINGKPPKDKSESIAGPLYATDVKNNISIDFKFHGQPARPSHFIRKDTIKYIVNELDVLQVDSRSVILICVGTHYTTYPISMYEKRMRDIHAAVKRLLLRSPQTLVVFKSANTRAHAQILHQLHNSEWYIRTLDLALRDVLKDSPELALIDAWDITIAQNAKDNVHPGAKTLNNLLNYFLSYICPDAP